MSSTVHQNSSDTTSAVDAISSPPPPLQNPLFRVLYMTDEMVVVDKPHGVPMDGVHHPHTVEKWIQSQMKSDEEARDDTIMKNAGAAEEDTTAVGGSSSLSCGYGDASTVDSVEGGIGKHRMPKGYFTTPLPQGNRHTSSGGNAGPSRKQLKFVHQLDAPTSGLLCLSFSRDVAARLGHCFQMRKSVKVYSAILFGWVGEEGGDQDGGANGNGGQTIEGGETGSRSGHGAASRGTPSHDRNVVFEGIPTPLNDYLASAPNSNTLESSDAVGMLKPLSPFAALYDPSSTTTTTVVLEGGGGVDETTTVSASPILTSPSPTPHLLPPNTLIHIEAPIGNDPAQGSTLMTIGGNNPRDASSLLQVVKRGYVTLPIPSSSSSSSPTGQDASDASGSGNNSSSGVVVKATHVLLRLYTGRRHQLRLHCRHIGHPIVGDASYASEVPLNANLDTNTLETMNSQSSARSSPPVLAERMYLHAWRLAFFDSFEVGDHGKRERVEARKKRRRESLGINNRGGGGDEDGTEVTGVATGPDPFAHLVVD